jgi:hypothetical protein
MDINTSNVAPQFKSHTGRSCCRCRKDLTDMASIEAGIGPICRKQDNKLLANSIPANPPEALMALLTINPDTSITPDAQATYADLLGMLTLNLDGTDWRIAIRKIEKILSYDSTRWKVLKACSEVARWLGYLGVAALWNGEAATGDAVVRFDPLTSKGPRIFVDGPRCPAARHKLHSLGAVNFPSPKPGRRMFGVDPKHLDAFATIVQTHYPMSVGLADARVEVEAFLATSAVLKPTLTPVTVQATPAPGGPVSTCRIEKNGNSLKINTPYDATFIAGFKNMIPYKDRSWDAATKAWMCDASYLPQVTDLITQVYKKTPTYIDVAAISADMASVMKHVDNAQALADAAAASKAAIKAAAVKQTMITSHTPVINLPKAPAPYVPEKPTVLPF